MTKWEGPDESEEALKRYLAKGKVIEIVKSPRVIVAMPESLRRKLDDAPAPKKEPVPRKVVAKPPPKEPEPEAPPPTKYSQGDAVWVPDYGHGLCEKATVVNTSGPPKHRRVTVRFEGYGVKVVDEKWTRRPKWSESCA